VRLLFVSNLFPNARQPGRGVFNAQQVRALSKLCTVTVIAPTEVVTPDETVQGVRIYHPRFHHVPWLSRPFNGRLFARAIEPLLTRESFDIALASWAYPDGYGLMLLARRHGFPFATQVLGSDVNVLFRNRHRKRQVLETLRASQVVLAKSNALRDVLAAEGIRALTDYNGINHDRFRLLDRAEARGRFGLTASSRVLLYVGNLLKVKGPRYLAEAFTRLTTVPGLELVVLGDGPEVCRFHGVARVRLLGRQPHAEIPWWMNAADLLCLPSLQEGLPNVILEALACGLPVVASRTGGVPEIVVDGQTGLLVPPGDSAALAGALRTGLERPWDREALSRSVAGFNWERNARLLIDELTAALPQRDCA